MYGAMIATVLSYFTTIDYQCEVVKNLFLEKDTDKKFFEKYIVEHETKKKSRCEEFFADFLAKEDRIDPAEFQLFKDTKSAEVKQAQDSLRDGDVDESDIKTMVFEIFSGRKKFVYGFKQRVNLYFGFLGKILKTMNCKMFDYDLMMHNRKVFSRATATIDKDCDIIDVMNCVRKTKNFTRNFMNREQKILMKFDQNNIIDGEVSSEST